MVFTGILMFALLLLLLFLGGGEVAGGAPQNWEEVSIAENVFLSFFRLWGIKCWIFKIWGFISSSVTFLFHLLSF